MKRHRAALALVALGGVLSCRTSTGGVALRSTRPTVESTRLEMVWPRPLSPGDTIAFVAPAGELDRERMALARQRLEARGYEVVERDDLFSAEGYLAGSDERRAEELMQAFRDPEVDAIFPGTGGYGTMRILDRLDYRFIRAHPKWVIGFSDITGLHAALNRRAGLVTLHSPSPMWGLGSPEGLDPFAERWFFRALEVQAAPGVWGIVQEEVPPEGASSFVGWGHGKARGRLVGGNLSLISALEGTPYAIDTRGAILVIEDVREAPYRVDRMLKQLELAGKLDSLRGAVLAQFTRNYDREDEQRRSDPRFTVDGVLRQYFGERGIPVLFNFPLGHVERNASLPLGGLVEIDADRATLTVLEREPTPWLESAGGAVAAARWSRTAVRVQDGLERWSLRAGHPALAPRFQVQVGEYEVQADADAGLESLEAAGYPGRIGYVGGAKGAYGVFLPDFADRASADATWRRLARGAFPKATLREVGHDLSSPSGPWAAQVLEVDPARFRLEVVHSTDEAIGLETTRSTARRHGAAAAINGGYYVTRGATRGDSAGFLRIDHQVLSETDRQRSSVGFLDQGGRTTPLFGRIAIGLSIRRDGDVRLSDVDGINRERGRGEIVLYTPEFHRSTLTDGGGVEVVVRAGQVAEIREGQGSSLIPSDGWVLSIGPERVATGPRFQLGEDKLAWEASMTPDREVSRWALAEDAVSGGPLLLREGRRVTDWASEPFSRAFFEARHPRTALGVKADGTLLLVTVDGRQPEWSVGMSLPELTDLLLELGAVDAINLDGGGSTTMVVGDQVINRPSDPTGERENGDAVLVIAR